MTVLQALILGLVQGFTEFLPVSSSGHLVLVPEFFNIPNPPLGFDILLHLATLVAVVGYFARDVGKMVVSVVAPGRMSRSDVKFWRRLIVWLVIGTIPAGLAGVLLDSFFESLFSSTLAVGAFLVVTSLLLIGADIALGRVHRDGGNNGLKTGGTPGQGSGGTLGLGSMRAADALVVGCFQALAIAPGISRSGATMAGGIFLGFDRETAARFSFLLSIPAILGAGLIKLKDISGAFTGATGPAYAVGAAAALVSGFAAVYLLLRYVKKHRLRLFAAYTLVLGVFVIVLSLA